MANSRTLYLTSMWSLEDRGIPELRDKLNALNPGASMKVEYLRDKHILVVTGQFDEEYDLEITSLLAEYIEEHRNDDLLDMPRVRQLPTSAYFDPIPLPGSGSDAQPDVETLVEDIMPTQTTRDGRIVKFWYPSQAGLGPISRDSGPLLSRISQMTETRITVQGTRGLRISAQSMDKINYAVNTLDSVEECLDLIENPNQGLIIFTPKRDNATFRIMPYEQISATALWRILIDRNAPLRLPNIMTLVVCEFDELANEFRPLRKLRQPPQVSLKEASITRDWEGHHVPEIGQRNDPLGKVDQHLAPKSETPHDKIDAQHPYLSTGKAKDVSKWISQDFTKGALATEGHTKIPQEDDPSSPDFPAAGLAPEPGVSLSWRQRQSSQFKPKPPGVKGRVIMLPDGTIALPSQSPQEKPLDIPYGPNISVFSRLSYRERVRHQQLAGSSVSASQEKRPAGTLRGATDSTAPSAASKQSGKMPEATGLAASYLTSTQESESNDTLGLPLLSTPSGAIPKQLGETSDLADPDLTISPTNQQEKPSSTLHSQTRSSSPIFNRVQPLGIPEVAESQVNTKLQGRSVDAVMGEIRLMLETANITRETGGEEAPSKPKITNQKQPRTISTQLDLSTEKTDSLGPLIDLDCEVRTLNSGIQHIAAFGPLVTALSIVPGQSTGPEHDHLPHGDAPTFAETGDIFDMPNIDDTTKQSEITRGISPCPERTRDSMIPREATLNPAPSEPAQLGSTADMSLASSGAAGSSQESDASEDEQIHEHASEPRSKADEVAMEYLLQQIKDNPSPEVLSIEEIAVPLDATLSDPAPRGLSPDSRDCTPHYDVQQRHSPSQGSEKVPFLHPDLIDISPQMLSPRSGASSGDCLQKSSSKNDEHDAEPVVDEKLAVSDEAQTREFHETMFHQRPSDKAFQWVDELTKAVKRPKIEVHTNPLERGEDTEINKENKTKVKAPIAKLWQRRTGFKSTEAQPRKETVLPINAAVELSKEKKLIYESTQSLFRFLEPILDAVRSFPGALSFQIQFGLMFMPSLPASTKEREMSYREVHQLFFSEHNLTPPPVSFFQRLTSSPADIDYLIDLEVNQSRLFDQKYSHRGVKYEFWCRVGPNRTIIISVNELGDAMVRYPEFSLGSVHLSFPSQVWDAAARVQGFIEYITGADPELDEAARMMAKSIRVEPNNQNLRMLVRVPTESKIRIDQVFMERWSRHPYCSERSKDLFLQISETQELFGTPSVLDPEIKVFQNAPLDQMVKDGKQWWQASIVSSKVDEILKSNSFLEPGERNESWCPTDLLGAEIMNFIPSTTNEGLSTLGAEVGHSGIAAMFQLARTVAQNIDAVGYWNRGPASIDKRTNTSNERSRSGTGTVKESSSHLGKELVTWVRPPKHRW